MSYRIKTPSQIETAKKRAANLKSTVVYLDPQKRAAFCNWIYKKSKFGHIEFSEREVNILKSLDRIKKINQIGLFRVWQFISALTNGNKSFYFIMDGRGAFEVVKDFDPVKFKIIKKGV
jgi:hypothetical protein